MPVAAAIDSLHTPVPNRRWVLIVWVFANNA